MKSVFAARRVAHVCCCAAMLVVVLAAGPSAAQQPISPYAYAINAQNAFVDLAARVKPAVVTVYPEGGDLGIKEVLKHGVERLPQAIGSGFIVDTRGYLITNEHVVHGGVNFSVQLSDGTKYEGKVVGKDQLLDIALVKIVVPEEEQGRKFPKVDLAKDSDQVRPGMWAIALGNPIGFYFDDPEPVMTIGIVSGVHRTFAHTLEAGPENMRTYGDLIQTDAAINPGNSGGPLFNIQGEVIGVNTLGTVIPGEGRAAGMNFAVPVNTVRRKIPLMSKGYGVKRPMPYGTIDARFSKLDEHQAKLLLVKGKRGVLVKWVDPEGPAAEGGMQEKDVILGVNGRRVGNRAQLVSLIAHMAIGEPVQFAVHRLVEEEGEPAIVTRLTLTVTLKGKTLRQIMAGSGDDEDD